MSKYKTKRLEGFTIIEVLIVLAIVGLIMLVIFLAVPNLQRNQRNNAYRTDASSLLGAYTEISSNKNGAVLAAADEAAVLAAANTRSLTDLTVEAEAGTTVPNDSYEQAVIRTKAKCNGTLDNTDPGSGRQIAILFKVETTGGAQTQCVES